MKQCSISAFFSHSQTKKKKAVVELVGKEKSKKSKTSDVEVKEAKTGNGRSIDIKRKRVVVNQENKEKDGAISSPQPIDDDSEEFLPSG